MSPSAMEQQIRKNPAILKLFARLFISGGFGGGGGGFLFSFFVFFLLTIAPLAY